MHLEVLHSPLEVVLVVALLEVGVAHLEVVVPLELGGVLLEAVVAPLEVVLVVEHLEVI